MSRWVELYATSPSGKTLFVCRMCGRKSPTPDKACGARPETYQRAPLECAMLEEIEGALADEQGRSEDAELNKIVMVAERSTPGPEGMVRYAVVWRSLKTVWKTNEIYFLGDPVPKEET